MEFFYLRPLLGQFSLKNLSKFTFLFLRKKGGNFLNSYQKGKKDENPLSKGKRIFFLKLKNQINF